MIKNAGSSAAESKAYELHIIHIITGLNTGGTEMALLRLLTALRPPEYQHTVVALGPEAELSGKIASLAELHHLGMHAGRMTPLNLVRLRRIIRCHRPHVIQAWMYHANLMATLAGWDLQVPVIWGIRQSLYDIAKEKRATRLVIRANKWLSRKPARIIFNSTVGANHHVEYGFSPTQVNVIPNGFDTNIFKRNRDAGLSLRKELGIEAETLVIGLVARYHPIKDHANFLRAASQFIASHLNAMFVLVGDGVDQSNLKLSGLIDELQLRSKVRLCGRLHDIPAVNNALDIASSSSWGEGFSNAIAEAMACGTPCVATDVGDVCDIIGDTGIVVPPHDSVALSNGWTKLAALGAEGRRDLGERARRRIIERYSLTSNAEQYTKLYTSLVKEKSTCVA